MLRHVKGNVTKRCEKERQESEMESTYKVTSKEMKIKNRWESKVTQGLGLDHPSQLIANFCWDLLLSFLIHVKILQTASYFFSQWGDKKLAWRSFSWNNHQHLCSSDVIFSVRFISMNMWPPILQGFLKYKWILWYLSVVQGDFSWCYLWKEWSKNIYFLRTHIYFN